MSRTPYHLPEQCIVMRTMVIIMELVWMVMSQFCLNGSLIKTSQRSDKSHGRVSHYIIIIMIMMQMIRDNSLCPLRKCEQSLLRDRGCAQSRQWPQIQRGLLNKYKYKESCLRNTKTIQKYRIIKNYDKLRIAFRPSDFRHLPAFLQENGACHFECVKP